MFKPISIVAGLLTIVALAASGASAADVELVIGTIVSPANLKPGDSVPIATTIRTGADGLVMLTQTWASDIPGYPCESVAIFGYGQTYTVTPDATPGSCRITAPLAIPDAGRAILSRATRYADPKFDDFSVPSQVTTSQEQWRTFNQWIGQTRQSAGQPKQSSGPMGPLVPGLVYLQGDYRSEPVASAEQCSALCAQEAQCRAVTFIISQRLCWLKNTVPGTATSSDMISAAKR